ncbi:hypothetical protein D3C80_2068990 [compost metagenome]
MAQLFGGDIHQQVATARVLVRETLGEVAHGRRQFALGSPELLEHQGGEDRIGFAHPHSVHQLLVVHEHGQIPVGGGA